MRNQTLIELLKRIDANLRFRQAHPKVMIYSKFDHELPREVERPVTIAAIHPSLVGQVGEKN
jgi:hypothetical protein